MVVCQSEDCYRQMAKTKQTARKTNTPGMSTYQDDSTSSSSSGEEVDTDAEESRQKATSWDTTGPSSPEMKGRSPKLPKGANKVQGDFGVFLWWSEWEPAGPTDLPRVPNSGGHSQDQEDKEKHEVNHSKSPGSRGTDRVIFRMV